VTDDTRFREVGKEEFKEIYFRLGGGPRSGWTEDYWRNHFEKDAQPGWKYVIEEPKSPAHDSMMIVADGEAKEHRLFFMTEDSMESFFDNPGKDD
jgi:hypothetical protein